MPSSARDFAKLIHIQTDDNEVLLPWSEHNFNAVVEMIENRDANLIRAAQDKMRRKAAAVCGAHTHANLILALPLDPPAPDAPNKIVPELCPDLERANTSNSKLWIPSISELLKTLLLKYNPPAPDAWAQNPEPIDAPTTKEAFNKWDDLPSHSASCKCVECKAPKRVREQVQRLTEACEFAKGALMDAIGLEDGLDSATGKAVLKMIQIALQALAPDTGKPERKLDLVNGRHNRARQRAAAEKEKQMPYVDADERFMD